MPLKFSTRLVHHDGKTQEQVSKWQQIAKTLCLKCHEKQKKKGLDFSSPFKCFAVLYNVLFQREIYRVAASIIRFCINPVCSRCITLCAQIEDVLASRGIISEKVSGIGVS